MTRAADPATLARTWIDDWNRHDLEAILAHYADDVIFEAPTVVARFGRPDGILRGIAELREHFTRGLTLVPHLRFTLEDVFLAPSGYAVLYRRENGNRVVDVAQLDGDGRIAVGRAHYVGPQR